MLKQLSASTREHTSASHLLLYVVTMKDYMHCIMYWFETEQARFVCESQ